MSSLDPNKCLQVIKLLQNKNEELKLEKNNALKEQNEMKDELSLLHKKLNDVLQERDRLLVAVKSKSKYDSPTSSNAAMEALIAQNQSLREELTAATSQEQVQDVVKISNLKETINQCKKMIASKNEQIVALQLQHSQTTLAVKVNKLQNMLKKTKVVNQTYARHIESLQEQLNSFLSQDNQETQVKTVSGDQDLSAIGHLDTSAYEEEIQELKSRIQTLKSQLQDAREKLKKADTIHETLKADCSCLENENLILTKQNRLLSAASTSDFPMDSQMKIFVDDFNEERSEKEKQWKENLEIKGENTRLKHKVDDLTALLRRQSVERPQQMQPSLVQSPPAVMPSQPSYDDHAYRSMFGPSYGHVTPSTDPVSLVYPDNPNTGPPMVRQLNYHSMGGAGHGNTVQPVGQENQRRIGFSGSGPQARPPRPNSFRQQIPVNPYQNTPMPQPHQPSVPPHQGYMSQMSQPRQYYRQPANLSYQPSSLQPDSTQQMATAPGGMVPTTTKKQNEEES